MQTEDPIGLLADVEALKTRTSRALNADGWQWTMVWGVVAFGAGLTVLVESLQQFAGYYWIVAVPVALTATALFEQRSKNRRAVRRSAGRYWLIGAAMGIVNFGASMVLESELIVIVIWVVIGLGFAGFAALDGNRPTAWMWMGAALLTAVLGVVSEDPFTAYATISMLFAGLLVGSAVQAYVRYR